MASKLRSVVISALFMALLAGIVLYEAGGEGLRYLLVPQALLLVYLGTAVLTFARRAIGRGGEEPLIAQMRNNASIMGAVSSLIGTILLLWLANDISELPRRAAFSLSGLFHGLLISEVLLAPFDDGPRTGGKRRWVLAAGSAALAGGGILLFLHELSVFIGGGGR